MVVAGVAIAAATWTTSAALRSNSATAFASVSPRDSLGPGPDSARVATLLASLGTGDALVCDLLSEQIGNFWWNDGDDGIGAFGDAKRQLSSARDSLHGSASHPGTLRLLTTALAADNPCVRKVAAKLLGRSRIETSRLAALLSDASPRVREAAAYAIASGHHRDARGALETLLRSGGTDEAAMAAWALGEAEDSAAVPALLQGAKAPATRVRLASVSALGEIKDERALPVLERALTSDQDAAVRARAAHSIGEMGMMRSIEALNTAIGDGNPLVRYAAIEAIGEMHDMEHPTAALLQAARSSDPKLQRLAAMAIAEIHDPTSIDALIALAGVDDRDVRLKVSEALGSIGSVKGSSALMRLLKDPDAEVRRAAAESLGQISANGNSEPQ
jgi:HEAT repeat protein